MTVQLSGSAELAEVSPKTWDIWRCVDSVHSCERCVNLNGRSWVTGTSHPVPPLHYDCACLIEVSDKPSGVGGSEESMGGKSGKLEFPGSTGAGGLAPWDLRTEPTVASALWVLDGETRLPADAERIHSCHCCSGARRDG